MEPRFDKREYDRKRAEIAYADFKQRRKLVIESLGGCCYLCSRHREFYHFHHVTYHETESAYGRHAKTFWVRLKRLEEAEAHPERFRILCSRCHSLVEGLQRALNSTNFDKLTELLVH
jgi:5-methylcytosine-specific restriction endonuclease McrA